MLSLLTCPLPSRSNAGLCPADVPRPHTLGPRRLRKVALASGRLSCGRPRPHTNGPSCTSHPRKFRSGVECSHDVPGRDRFSRACLARLCSTWRRSLRLLRRPRIFRPRRLFFSRRFFRLRQLRSPRFDRTLRRLHRHCLSNLRPARHKISLLRKSFCSSPSLVRLAR